MKTIPLFVAALLGLAFTAHRASAEFVLIDDLTTGHTFGGDLVGQTANGPGGGTWQGLGGAGTVTIGTSASTGGAAAIASALDGAAYITLPTPIAADSSAATIFFQFDMGSAQDTNNINWSLENHGTAANGGGANANNVIELNANVPNRAGLTIRNGGNFNEMSADGVNVFVPESATLYNIWYLVDNSAKTYEIYMAGGILGSTPVHMEIATGAYSQTPLFTGNFTGAFRNPTAATAVTEFVFGPGGSNNNFGPSLVTLSMDSSSLNTAYPSVFVVPEPAPMMLLVLGGGVVAILRGRRRQ
jgi:hypothetical protein